MRFPILATGLVVTALLGNFALAQGAVDPALIEAHSLREAHMKAYGAQLTILGGMAQDKVAYDPTIAAEAATKLDELAHLDISALWPEGSDSDAIPDSRALPLIWANMDDLMAKEIALSDATTALAGVAGSDLDSLKAAFGAVGGACGDCHKTYRKPE